MNTIITSKTRQNVDVSFVAAVCHFQVRNLTVSFVCIEWGGKLKTKHREKQKHSSSLLWVGLNAQQ